MSNKPFQTNKSNFSMEALAIDFASLWGVNPKLINNPAFIERLSLFMQSHESYPENISAKLFSSLHSKTIIAEDYEYLQNSLVSHFNSIPLKASKDINDKCSNPYEGSYISPVGNVTFQFAGYGLQRTTQDPIILNSYTTYYPITSGMQYFNLNFISYPNSPDKNESHATREKFNKLGILTSYSHISTISDTSRKTTYTRDPKCPFIVEITSPEGTKYMVVSASSFNDFNTDNNNTFEEIGDKYFSSKREAEEYLETCQQALVDNLLDAYNDPNIKKFLKESGFDIDPQVH